MSSAKSATISACGRYRYHLGRTWVEAAERLCFIMLNPSTADDYEDDPTIRRCVSRGMAMGFGGIDVVNLFAWRSPSPLALTRNLFVVSEERDVYLNDRYIQEFACRAKMVICAWGRHGAIGNRGARVRSDLATYGVQPFALKLNLDGSPAHPLYIKSSQRPIPF